MRRAAAARVDEAVRLYLAGATLREVGLQLGVHKVTVRGWLVSRGIERRPSGRSSVGQEPGSANPARDEELRRLVVDEHLPLKAAGAAYGISGERVRQVLARRFGLVHRRRQPGPRPRCALCGQFYDDWRTHRAVGAHVGLQRRDSARLAAAVAAYVAGVPTDAIYRAHAIAPPTLYRLLRYSGVSLRQRRRQRTSPRREAILADQRPASVVAAALGVNRSYVYYVRARSGGAQVRRGPLGPGGA